jgi:predicted ArsR family transcriptional regulator
LLNISPVAVRQHLSSLEAEGMLMVHVERRSKGRPSHRYALTARGDETFPRCYDVVANILLEELRTWQGEEAVNHLFERQRERMTALIQTRLGERSLPARLHELARIHSENGFMAEACEEDDSFLLIKRNCALRSIARQHPMVCCQGEEGMMRHLLGAKEVVHEKSIVEGEHYCQFRIRHQETL